MDAGNVWTDRRTAEIERQIAAEYRVASGEMRVKLEKHMAEYQKELSMRLKALDDTPEARKAHKAWLSSQAAKSKYLKDMVDSLAQGAVRADMRAVSIINGELPQIYAEGANYAAFEVDRAAMVDTSFTLLDGDSVRELAKEGNAMLPQPKVSVPKDLQWNRQKLTSALTQGIMQGESIPGIANRLQSVIDMDRNAAVRTARTAVTGSENAGRVSSYERAKELGIKLRQEWVAALDGRTRDTHRLLDGQKVEVGESWETENGPIRFPGDPMADPAETYNCRCTLVADVEGAGQDAERWDRLPEDVSYGDWKEGKYRTDAQGNETLASMADRGLQNEESFVFTKPSESAIITEGRYAPIDLEDAIAEIEGGKTNSLSEWVEDGKLIPERKAVHDGIIDDLLEGKTPTGDKPKMTMLGGGPASGKSSVMNPDTKGNPHAITIDPDDMKKRLPGFAEMAEADTSAASYYHEESSALAKRFSEVAYSRHLDAIYDGTGDGSVNSVMKKVNAARANGYTVEAKYVTIDTDEAIRRNRKRYDDAVARGETPRLPPEKMVRDTHAKVTDISVELAPEFDRIEVWDNNGGRGEQVLIAVGGNGKWLKPTDGMEDKFVAYLGKGSKEFERLADGSYRPRG